MNQFLVFGFKGQVARELSRVGNVKCLGRAEADLEDPAACSDAIKRFAPLAVINAAAYTAVDKAEGEEAVAEVINAYAPRAMAEACAEMGIPFVHISTDYVFEGLGLDPFMPSDQTAPQNAYGRSKLVGENFVRTSGCVFAIVRTSWVFSAHGSNFVKTMLRLGQSRDQLSVVSDQVGGPTSARAIAHFCMKVAEQLKVNPSKSGVFHFSGAPTVSWAEFAQHIFKMASLKVSVTGIRTADYPTPAVRPLNSRLDCSDTYRVFGEGQPDWKDELSSVLTELGAVS
ncbi:dTDP-4-dehydrorhamnose reductase [bacterium]|nr:dTDP-4-dehydrorhamnose reductase [bacterium]